MEMEDGGFYRLDRAIEYIDQHSHRARLVAIDMYTLEGVYLSGAARGIRVDEKLLLVRECCEESIGGAGL